MDLEVSSVMCSGDQNYGSYIRTITGSLIVASSFLINTLFSHVLHYDGITQYPCGLLEMPCFIISFHNTLQLKLLLAVTLILTLITKIGSPSGCGSP